MMTEKFVGLSANSQISAIYDGKKARTAIRPRKTVDMHVTVIRELETRVWQRDARDRPFVQPDALYFSEMTTPAQLAPLEVNAICTKYVRTNANKGRCPIFCVTWTPEGRRLITGANTGEFTLWNGITFNFETILQAHDTQVRDMRWSHDDMWMLTTDNNGWVKYWQANMNNVHTFRAHDEACRSVSFSPTDVKFATCSDDGTVRIWDMYHKHDEPERVLKGHGSDVKVVDWHPEKGLLASGSKDSQQPVILWDPRSGKPLTTIREHRNSVSDLSWNKHNGNWLATGSRDHLIKLYDIRMMKRVQDFRGHKRDLCCLAWHPIHEGMLASGGWDGSLYFWSVGCEQEIGSFDTAHDSQVWSISWHPLGHILCTGSNDYTTKFWTRHRPGEDLSEMKFNRDSAVAAPNKEPLILEEVEPEPMSVEQSDVLPGLSSEQELDMLSSQHRHTEIPKRISHPLMEERVRHIDSGAPSLMPSHLQRNAPIQPQHIPTGQGPPRQHIEPEPTTFRSSFPSSSDIYKEPMGTPLPPIPQNPVPGLGDSHMGPMQGMPPGPPGPPGPHGHPGPPGHPGPHGPLPDNWQEYDQGYDDWDYPKEPPRPMPPFNNPHETAFRSSFSSSSDIYKEPMGTPLPPLPQNPVPGLGDSHMGPMQGMPPGPHGPPDNWQEYDQGYDDWEYPKEPPRPMPPFNPHEPPYPLPPGQGQFDREPMWGHGGRGMMRGRGMPWARGWPDDRGRRGKGPGRGKRGGR